MVRIERSEPDGDGGEFDEAHDMGEQFVMAGGDAPEVFEFVEEAFDGSAFFMDCYVIVDAAWDDDVRARRIAA